MNIKGITRAFYPSRPQISTWQAKELFRFSSQIEYLTALYQKNSIQCVLNGTGQVDIKLCAPHAVKIEMGLGQISFRQEVECIGFALNLKGVDEFKVTMK